MLPRYAADYRVLAWCLAMPVFAFAPYVDPGLLPYTAAVSAYLALAAGVFAHNHNHCPTFKSRRANALFAKYLSLFYGYPTFAWVPTHNLNHHKFINKAGDATITWRYSDKNNWLVAGTYFFVSSYWQSDPIKAYIRKAKQNNPKLHREIMSQYTTWAGWYLAVFALAVVLHGWKTGLLVWIFAFGYPAFHALWTIMFFNYVQHVHADPWSAHNHSRNFTGWLLNFTLFNNGLHAAHHENPGAHWSTLPALHAKIAPEIHPDLNANNTAWWLLKTYVLSIAWPRFGTKQVGRAPFDAFENGSAVNLTSGDVDAVEAGVNAQMV
jgi:fatty acid desaturase